MANDVLITPASGVIEFKDATVTKASITVDASNNLILSTTSGEVFIGTPGTNVYVGDGVNSVDLIFEQNGAVRAANTKTLTIGSAGSSLSIASPTTTSSTITSTVATGTAPLVVASTTRVSNLNVATAGTADTLTTGRTISITGDLAYTSPTFNGSGNITAAGTLATVNSNVGTFTNATVTVNAKGLVTGVSAGTGSSATLTIQNKTSSYTVVAGDLGTIINCTAGTLTISLTAAATLGAGFNVTIWNNDANSVTIDPSGAETIDGVATLVLLPGEGTEIVCNGTNWETNAKKSMRLYSENTAPGIARPSATGNRSVALGSASVASTQFSFAAGGISATASGSNSLALGSNTTASANFSTAIGSNSGNTASQAVSGAGAMALGGSYASGVDSFAAAVGNNTSTYGATAANSVAIGQLAKAASTSVAIGSLALTTNSGIAISVSALRGVGATASSNGGCIAIGGNSTASAFSAVAIGQDAVSADSGKLVFSPIRLATNGDAQTGIKVLSASTTNATSKVLSTGDTGAADQLILPNNSAYAFSGIIVARRKTSEGTQSAAWKVEGLIRREGSAGTTVLVNSAMTVLSNVPGWVIALSADTTNGGLSITATGAAATNIRWVATLHTSELTYA